MDTKAAAAILCSFFILVQPYSQAGEAPGKVKIAQKILNAKLAKAQAEYDQIVERADKTRQRKIKVAVRDYQATLNLAMKDAMRNGNLQEANQIKELQTDTAENLGASAPKISKIKVWGKEEWQETEVRVSAGQRLKVSASGKIQLNKNNPLKWGLLGPNGRPDRWVKIEGKNIERGRLIMKIGTGDKIYSVGKKATLKVPSGQNGVLHFMIADDIGGHVDNSGNLKVKITVYP